MACWKILYLLWMCVCALSFEYFIFDINKRHQRYHHQPTHIICFMLLFNKIMRCGMLCCLFVVMKLGRYLSEWEVMNWCVCRNRCLFRDFERRPYQLWIYEISQLLHLLCMSETKHTYFRWKSFQYLPFHVHVTFDR